MPRVRAALALAPLAASLALALAGCLAGPEGDPAPASSDPEPASTAAALPEDIALSRSVTASHYNPAGPCTGQHTCTWADFTVPPASSVRMSAQVIWGVPASEFDLVLYQGDAEVVADYGTLDWPGAEIDAELGPGDYRVLVDAYAVTQDSFDLAVRFAPA